MAQHTTLDNMMKPHELKNLIESAHRDSKFFSRENMRFAGDTMRNYGVRSAIIRSNEIYSNGLSLPVEIEVWELYRRKPVKHRIHESAYFCKTTLQRVYKIGY